ncbi:MAG: alanyl-tRNA editing protein [Pseudomonadota bacterium]
MTGPLLYRQNAYLRTLPAVVLAHEDGGVVLDTPLFYPQGGGQPGDAGALAWGGATHPVVTTLKGATPAGRVMLAEGAPLPAIGTEVMQTLAWDQRFDHMRVHTALHLLSVVIPLPVTGGSISAGKGRLDFDMPEAPENKGALEAELNALIARDLAVSEDWITEAELAANPGLVKTMSVKPPMGAGRVRLVRIGDGEDLVDLQPCGGTHVSRTGEIGPVQLGKIEKKGRQNRRVSLLLAH